MIMVMFATGVHWFNKRKKVVTNFMDKKEQIKLAASLLHWTDEKAEKLCREKPDLDALYFYEKEKGGISLLVSKTGEVLFANSAVSPKELFDAFRKGVRTDKKLFG